MNTRIASYSAQNLLKKLDAKKISGKLLQEAYSKGIPYDLEILNMMHPDCGRYVTPKELKDAGEKEVFVRFNQDRNFARIKL